jgi:hypothetical protein
MLGLRVISYCLTYKIMDEVCPHESSLFINNRLNFLIKGSFIYLEILQEIICSFTLFMLGISLIYQ